MPGENHEWYDLPELITEAWKALLLAVPFLFRKVRVFFLSLLRSKKMKQLEADMREIKSTLSAMTEQFKPNGGKSFYDMLTGLKDDTEYLKSGVRYLNARMERTEHNMNVMTMDIDRDGMLLNENHLVRELFGKTHEELKGYEYMNTIHPDDRKFFLQQVNEAVDLKIKLDTEVRIVRNDVSQRIRINGNPIMEDNSPTMFLCTVKKL